MIRSYVLLVAFVCGGLALSAQITIDDSDIPPFGAILSFGEDTLVDGLSPGPAGAGQSWDFSALQTHITFQNSVLAPEETPYAADFSDATFALLGTDGFYTYTQATEDAFVVLGGSAPLPGGGSAVARFEMPEQLLTVPATFGSAFSNEFRVDVALDGSAFGVDSVRLVRAGSKSAEVDAWGSLSVPSGTYETLRQRVESSMVDSIFVQIFGNWALFTTIEEAATLYEWWAKDGRAQVLSLEYDTGGNALSATYLSGYSEAAVPPVAAFSYEIIGDGEVQFTDESENSPVGWLWNFGDGSTSLNQNPAHTYAASGVYEVCLTVANGAGQDVLCQEVDIMVAGDEEALAAAGIRAYPSPFSDVLTVELGPFSGRRLRLALVNGLGQVVKQERLENAPQRLALPAEELRPGIYRLAVEVDGKRVKVLSVSKL